MHGMLSPSEVSDSLQPHRLQTAKWSIEFSMQEYWSGAPFPTPGDLPNAGIEAALPALAGRFFITGCFQFIGPFCILIHPQSTKPAPIFKKKNHIINLRAWLQQDNQIGQGVGNCYFHNSNLFLLAYAFGICIYIFISY